MAMPSTQWESVIGLEIHVQLCTQSKIFSSASTTFGAKPNEQANLVDLAMPGSLPVFNGAVLRMAIRFGLAINAEIAQICRFDRKNYFYPDLAKGYQISQLHQPIIGRGVLSVITDNASIRSVGITRAHLEEDAGKSIHDAFPDKTGIDLNRAGTPLLEIVTDPDLTTPAEAAACFRQLHTLVTWLGICDGNMSEGSMRCDANVSVRPRGRSELGERTEIKNINSFRFVEKALEYEIDRQIVLIEQGGKVVRETRLYDPNRNETRSLREKEFSNNYRYFPDPDLPPIKVDSNLIESERASLPELPEYKANRYLNQYKLSKYHASRLTQDRRVAEFLDAVVSEGTNPQQAASWIMGEISAALNRDGWEFDKIPLTAKQLALLIMRVEDGTISYMIAKTIFEVLWTDGGDVDQIIEERGLQQITDAGQLKDIVTGVIDQHADQVVQYQAGKVKVLEFFIGQVMKASKGKADPKKVNKLLSKELDR